MSYWLGVVLAISSGVCSNLGSVFQKKAVNEIPQGEREQKFFRTLVRKPWWLFGMLIQYGFAASFLILAQVYIGPVLVPGLVASGLIVLVIGSIKLVGESLRKQEVLGIVLLMFGTIMFSLSQLEIVIPEYDFVDIGFLMRLGLFTGMLFVVILVPEALWRLRSEFHAVARALVSGILLAVSGYWISPLIATIVRVFSRTFAPLELALFVASCIILILTNIFAIGSVQDAFKTGQASLVIPIQQLPMQIVPGFIYLVVFFLAPPTAFSLVWFVSGVILTIISSFLLGKRQVMLEEIK